MITLILFCVACGAIWLRKYYNRNSKEPPFIPGGWPIVGHIPILLGNGSKLWKGINELAHRSYDVGGVGALQVGPRIVYIITDPDDLFTVANTCLEKDNLYQFARPWLGDGLSTGKLPVWKNHRKLLNPAFSQTVLDSFMGTFNSQSRKLVQDLDKEAGRGPFNHWDYTRHNALETICLTLLGVDFTDAVLFTNYFKAVELIFNTMLERFMKVWWHSPYTFHFSGVKKKQDACIKILHNTSDTILQRKFEIIYNNSCRRQSVIPGTKFKVFIDLLLELAEDKGVFNEQDIRDHVDSIIVGGHDTLANVNMFTMLLLGAYPEVQEKVVTELREVFGDEDRDVEKQDLSNLVYLEAVIKESMRIYSIAPVISRKLEKDVKLKNYTLSAGRMCFLLICGLHQHPIWGSDRHQFKPERWLDPSQLPKNPNAYAAFSVGRRMCIGKVYAMMSMKTTLVYLMRHYRITAENYSKLRVKFNVMLKPVSGYYISVERRT